VGLVARRHAARREEEANVAIMIPVGKRDTMPLLQVASTAGEGYVLEPRTGDVAEQDIGHHVKASRLARPQIYIKIAVIVDVAEVRAHDYQNLIQPGFPGRVAEAGGLFILVKAGPLAVGQLALGLWADQLLTLKIGASSDRQLIVSRPPVRDHTSLVARSG
jgi:hypothetical protein